MPFIASVINSFYRYRLSQPFGVKFNWGANYIDFMTDPGFWNTLKISLVYAGVTVILELLLGLGIALLLQKRTTFNNFVSIMLLMPLMTAPALAALMWKLMTNPGFGILSYFASLIGLPDFRWASSPSTALFTVVLVDIWVYTPFIMILLLAGLRSLPTQPFEAAALDGVPRAFVFFRITLPMLTPYILTATLFRLLDFNPAVRHHLRHDAGRAGRHADSVPGRGLSQLLPVDQCRPLRRADDYPLGDHLFSVEPVHQKLAAPARTRPRRSIGERRTWNTHPLSNASCAASRSHSSSCSSCSRCSGYLMMSFQTNETILRIPPSLNFSPSLENYRALITGKLETQSGTLDIAFMRNLGNSVFLSTASVAISLLLGVPAAYAFARHKFKGSEDIAFTLLSFRFAPPLLVLLPLTHLFPEDSVSRTRTLA